MKVEVAGFIIAKHLDHNIMPHYAWSAYDQTEYDKDSVLVGHHTIVFEVPDDFDYPLRKAKELIRHLGLEVARVEKAVEQLHQQIKENHE